MISARQRQYELEQSLRQGNVSNHVLSAKNMDAALTLIYTQTSGTQHERVAGPVKMLEC